MRRRRRRQRRRMEEAEEEEEEEAAQLTAALQYTERESETAVFDTPETRDQRPGDQCQWQPSDVAAHEMVFLILSSLLGWWVGGRENNFPYIRLITAGQGILIALTLCWMLILIYADIQISVIHLT